MREHFDPQIWEDFHGVQKQWKNTYSTKGDVLFANFASAYPEVDILQMI
jgi:hypothetical protein